MKALLTLLAGALILASCQPGPPTTGSSPSPGTTASPQASASPSSAEPQVIVKPSAIPSGTPSLDLYTGNLIPNPGVEQGNNNRPLSWQADSYGDLRADFTWPSDSAFSGKYYLSVHVSNYGTEGDAKWIFDPQPLKGDKWYEFRDMHRSDGRSRMLYSCLPAGGSRRYYNAWQSEVSSGWSEDIFRFYLPGDCTVSVIHSLDRNGFLDTDNQQLRVVDPRPLKQAMASITFDDIWKTSYTLGAPELEKRGFKGSFYVTQLYAETPADLYASVSDIQDLVKRGHEIGSHAHKHTNLSQLDTVGVVDDMRREVAFLKTLGVNDSGLAYPFGDFNAAVENETGRYHSYARTSLAGLNDATANRYKLRIVPVTVDSTDAELDGWLEAARKTNTWVIFLFHDLGDPLTQHPYRTSLAQYTHTLDSLKSSGVKVVTVAEGLKEAGL